MLLIANNAKYEIQYIVFIFLKGLLNPIFFQWIYCSFSQVWFLLSLLSSINLGHLKLNNLVQISSMSSFPCFRIYSNVHDNHILSTQFKHIYLKFLEICTYWLMSLFILSAWKSYYFLLCLSKSLLILQWFTFSIY